MIYRLTTIPELSILVLPAPTERGEPEGVWCAWIERAQTGELPLPELFGRGSTHRAALADLIRQLQTLIKEIDSV